MTWAAVANYDIHSIHDASTHFGHHEHQSSDHGVIDTDKDSVKKDSFQQDNVKKDNVKKDNVADDSAGKLKNHVHYGFLHLSCGVTLGQYLPDFAPEDNQYTNHYLFNYHSPPSNTLDRPNWFTPV